MLIVPFWPSLVVTVAMIASSPKFNSPDSTEDSIASAPASLTPIVASLPLAPTVMFWPLLASELSLLISVLLLMMVVLSVQGYSWGTQELNIKAGDSKFFSNDTCFPAASYPSVEYNYTMYSTNDDTYSLDWGIVLCDQDCCTFSSYYAHSTTKFSGDYTVSGIQTYTSIYTSFFPQFDIHCQNLIEDCNIYLEYLVINVV